MEQEYGKKEDQPASNYGSMCDSVELDKNVRPIWMNYFFIFHLDTSPLTMDYCYLYMLLCIQWK